MRGSFSFQGGDNVLTEEQRESMKQKQLSVYSARIFGLEMDATAARALGEDKDAEEIEKEIGKLRRAYAAVEQM